MTVSCRYEDQLPMTDIESRLIQEQWLSLSQAARLFPPARRGRPVSASCVWRWCKRGVTTADGRRVHLEVLRCVNRFITTEAAVRRFLSAMQPGATIGVPDAPPGRVPRTPGQRARADAQAADKLQKLGL
jgi:hypothetical protein